MEGNISLIGRHFGSLSAESTFVIVEIARYRVCTKPSRDYSKNIRNSENITRRISKTCRKRLFSIRGSRNTCVFISQLKMTIVLADLLQRYGHVVQKVEVLKKLQGYLEQVVYDEYLCAGSTELNKAKRLVEQLVFETSCT